LALRHAWDAELVAADHAAETIAAGPGRLSIHRGRVRDAHEHLDRWEARWREMLAGSELDPARLRYGPAVWRSSVEPVADALDQRVERLTRDPAITSLPDPQALLQRAETAWTLEQAAAYQQAVSREPSPFVSLSRDPYPAHEVEHGPSIGR